MAIKVGIPRALFYYKYFPLWKTFFNEIGAEIIVSGQTTKKIFDDGIKSCVDEACLPVKVFYGHVINLKDRVDYLFIPRFTSISKDEYVCPKFGGIPDMVRQTIKGLPEIIDTEINMRRSKKNSLKAAMKTGMLFCDSRNEIQRAYRKSVSVYREYRNQIRKGVLTSEIIDGFSCEDSFRNGANITPYHKSLNKNIKRSNIQRMLNIAVIGHAYNVYDSYINMNILGKLSDMGAKIITIEMLEEHQVNHECLELKKKMFWNFGRKAYGSVGYLLKKKGIDGIVYITSFGCGIDSFVCDLTERKIRRLSQLPFIILTIDEHSGEAGLNTRLEAFIDMIRWRDDNETDLSPHG